MTKKVLVIDYDKCSGCRMCEVVCSWYHEEEFNPAKSRIQIVSMKDKSIDIPIVCQQCDKPLCMESCQPKAISFDTKTNICVIDETKCIGCKLCITACIVSSVGFNPDKGVAIKCDLCNGEPQCVKYCPMNAIEFIEPERSSIKKKHIVATKLLSELVGEKYEK